MSKNLYASFVRLGRIDSCSILAWFAMATGLSHHSVMTVILVQFLLGLQPCLIVYNGT